MFPQPRDGSDHRCSDTKPRADGARKRSHENVNSSRARNEPLRSESGLCRKAHRPQTELIVNLAVITASVDRCDFEIDSRIIGLDLLKELMLIEDTLPNGRVHYNMAVGLRVAANAVQGAYDEDPGEWCESTWRNYGPDGVTKKGWITRRGAP